MAYQFTFHNFYSYFLFQSIMTHRAHYVSPQNPNKIIKHSADSLKPTDFHETLDTQWKNPESSKQFNRKPASRANQQKKSLQKRMKFKPRESFKQPIISLQQIAHLGHVRSPFSINHEKIIKTCSNRERRSGTQFFKSEDPRETIGLNSMENLKISKNVEHKNDWNDELKLLKEFNESLMRKNRKLNDENKAVITLNAELELKLTKLQEKYEKQEAVLKDEKVKVEVTQKSLAEQKQINRCLEEIILTLNAKISEIISSQGFEKYVKEISDLQGENRKLLEQTCEREKQVCYLQMEVRMLKREISQEEKLRDLVEKLQVKNKALMRKVEELQRSQISRVKSAGKVGKGELDYSISFDLHK